jgi:broad specificity phosphatase PhoE
MAPVMFHNVRNMGKIEAVAMDMSPASMSAVLSHLPDTTIVFDHFHVIKLFNNTLANLRLNFTAYRFRDPSPGVSHQDESGPVVRVRIPFSHLHLSPSQGVGLRRLR